MYQRFIASYAVKTEPHSSFETKNQDYIWLDEQQAAYEQLIKDVSSLPTLRQPDFSQPFELHSDAASTKGIGVILAQRDAASGDPYPLQFASRSLTDAEKNYSARNKRL